MNAMIFNLLAVGLCAVATILIRQRASLPAMASVTIDVAGRRLILSRVMLGVATICAMAGFMGALHPALH